MLSIDEAQQYINADSHNEEVLYPFLIANELVGSKTSLPTRYVIDFWPRDLLEAHTYVELFKRVKALVLPDRQKAADEETERNKEATADNPKAKTNHHHETFLNKWWQLSYPRADMLAAIGKRDRYIVCGCVTARPIFEFISPSIHPNAALMVFPYEDDYSFGILQSGIHWTWFINRCSTLKGDPRYTSNTVFDSFPWPQTATLGQIKRVAAAAVSLRTKRRALLDKHDMSLRELYRTIDGPGTSPFKTAHALLDEAVRDAYGMSKKESVLEFLLDLNQTVSAREQAGEPVTGPGLPPTAAGRKDLITTDCLAM